MVGSDERRGRAPQTGERAQSRARVQVIGGVGMRQEEEEMSDSGR